MRYKPRETTDLPGRGNNEIIEVLRNCNRELGFSLGLSTRRDGKEQQYMNYILATTRPEVAIALEKYIPVAFNLGPYQSQWESVQHYTYNQAQKLRDKFIKDHPDMNVRVEYFNEKRAAA